MIKNKCPNDQADHRDQTLRFASSAMVRTRHPKKKRLRPEEINLVRPRFRKTVRDAIKRGEKVPYSVTLLSDTPPTAKVIAWAQKIASRLEASPNDQAGSQ